MTEQTYLVRIDYRGHLTREIVAESAADAIERATKFFKKEQGAKPIYKVPVAINSVQAVLKSEATTGDLLGPVERLP